MTNLYFSDHCITLHFVIIDGVAVMPCAKICHRGNLPKKTKA